MSNKRPYPKQSEKFINAARELEADESEEAFDQQLRKIASQKPGKEAGPAKTPQ